MPRGRTRRAAAVLAAATATVAALTVAGLWVTGAMTDGARPERGGRAATSTRTGHSVRFWPNGRVQSDVSYLDDTYDGDYRTYYENGAPYERRRYVRGHETGLQQSWTEAGVLYLNCDVRDGRRYGLVNPAPCSTVGDNEAARPAGNDATGAARSSHGVVRGAAPGDARGGGTAPDATGLPYYGDPTFAPNWTPVPHRVATFDLDTQTGGRLSDRALRGRPYVASFIYTQCAAVCPILVTQLARVAQAIGPDTAHIVSFSVTPDTDTPEALARFGSDRGIDPARWSLLTGDRRAIYALARASFFADDDRVGASDDTAFLHTEKLLLVDGEGRLRGVYNGTQPHDVDHLIGDLRRFAALTRARPRS